MFLAVCDYIYFNIKGFLTKAKKVKPPANEFEAGVSKLLAIVTLLVGVALGGAFGFYGSGRFQAKGILLVFQTIATFGIFWKGISVSWMLRGLARYWIFPVFIIYGYWVAGTAILSLVEGQKIEANMPLFGFFILYAGLMGSIASFMHIRFLSMQTPPPSMKPLKYLALGFYGCVWLVAVGGGLVMIFFKQLDRLFN